MINKRDLCNPDLIPSKNPNIKVISFLHHSLNKNMFFFKKKQQNRCFLSHGMLGCLDGISSARGTFQPSHPPMLPLPNNGTGNETARQLSLQTKEFCTCRQLAEGYASVAEKGPPLGQAGKPHAGRPKGVGV